MASKMIDFGIHVNYVSVLLIYIYYIGFNLNSITVVTLLNCFKFCKKNALTFIVTFKIQFSTKLDVPSSFILYFAIPKIILLYKQYFVNVYTLYNTSIPPVFGTYGALKLIDKNSKTDVQHILQIALNTNYCTSVY